LLDEKPVIPKFITFEGGEGAGKSTQARLLADWLRSAGADVVLTREPGGSPGAERIRALLLAGRSSVQEAGLVPGRDLEAKAEEEGFDALTEAMLHYAARRDHCVKVIEPALSRGAFVISDRFSDSTIAYQGYGLGASLDALARLHDLAVPPAVRPGLTILLGIPAAEGLDRARKRSNAMSLPESGAGEAVAPDRYEGEGLAVHERISAGFDAIASAEPDRVLRVDGRLDLTQACNAIRDIVRARFSL
jgi:dTMP kinase